MKFEIVTTSAGVISIRNTIVGEIMHNPVGPWAEANALYIVQSRLRERLLRVVPAPGDELVIFDVGLGAAANSLATLHCARELNAAAEPCRPLKLVSFERDMELLQFALAHSDQFAHFAGFERAIEKLLETGEWREKGITWVLREGDFLQRIEDEPERAHLIWFDPYSPTVNLDMWTISVFEKLHAKCNEAGATLYTYSRATPIRVALFYSGFFVGAGQSTGLKDETTQAATRLADLAAPLGPAWLGRWQRSHTPNAFGSATEDFARIQRTVLDHPQFQRINVGACGSEIQCTRSIERQ